MLRTITQKCPSCGYVYVEQQHVEVQTVSIEKKYPEMELLVCPKCGTVLAPWVAMKVEVTEE